MIRDTHCDELREASAAARGIALLRLGLVPIVLLQGKASAPRLAPDLLPVIVAVFACYALATLVLSRRVHARTPWPLGQALIDLVFIAGLVYTSGGARSPLRFAFYVLPLGAALRLSPRLTSAWAALAVGTYLVVAIPHPLTDLPADFDLVAGEALSLVWVSAAAIMLSALVGRRERSFKALAAARRRLVQQSLAAETHERHRLAQALHDDAIQNLLSRQEVADQARGIAGACERALDALDQTHRQLREEIFAMHPVGLERAGLAAVLRSCATEAARRGNFDVSVTVDPEASGRSDDLVLASARELLANAARHSRAAHVEVSVRIVGECVQLTVADDGCGFAVEQLEQALAAGHIGLPSVTERVRAVGGRVEIDATEGRGATINALIPARWPQRRLTRTAAATR